MQFAGIPFAFLFGMLAGRIGAKTSIFIALAVYIVLTVRAYYMKTERDFYVLALMVATVQGGTQALSRSLFASMIPEARSSEFFGFFSIFEKFGAILGPAVFEMASRATGSSRSAILSVMVFFIAGAVVLSVCERRKKVGSGGGYSKWIGTYQPRRTVYQRPNPRSRTGGNADERHHRGREVRIHHEAERRRQGAAIVAASFRT